ncbi:CDPK-related kinase 3 [Perilla frutescens var. hirtella]|nr:CDPK-related kinase 3 [Perilla frutescens var. hirtella]
MAKKFKGNFKPIQFAGGKRDNFNTTGNSRGQPTPTRPPFKLLTAAKMAAMRENGLCYNCDETFTAGHECKNRISYMIMSEEEEEIYVQSMTTEEETLEPLDPTGEMKEVGGQKLHILINSGSTLSFIREDTAKSLGCALELTRPIMVRLANGNRMITSIRVNGFKWTIQDHQFTYSPRTLATEEGCCTLTTAVPAWVQQVVDSYKEDLLISNMVSSKLLDMDTYPDYELVADLLKDSWNLHQIEEAVLLALHEERCDNMGQKLVLWDSIGKRLQSWEDESILAKLVGKIDPCGQGSQKGGANVMDKGELQGILALRYAGITGGLAGSDLVGDGEDLLLIFSHLTMSYALDEHSSSSIADPVDGGTRVCADEAAGVIRLQLWCRCSKVFIMNLETNWVCNSDISSLSINGSGCVKVENCCTEKCLSVVHRDLKLENILFTSRSEDADMKLIDFGLSDFIRTALFRSSSSSEAGRELLVQHLLELQKRAAEGYIQEKT